jgi:DNA-binding response OmpR family regulator
MTGMDKLDRAALIRRIDELTDELGALKHTIAIMRGALASSIDADIVPGLTRLEKVMLGFLLKRGRASHQAIFDFVYAGDPGGGPHIETLKTRICMIRRKLPPGVEIRNVWGEGYEIPPASIELLKGKAQ